MITQIETDLINRLSPALTGIQVAACPDNPENYSMVGLDGAALIRYLSSVYVTGQELGPTALESLDQIPGARTLIFEIALLTRSLSTHQGVYPTLDEVIDQLTGYCPTGASEMLPVKDGFTSYVDGIWYHFIQFSTTVP